jgi:hypothetical protein
MKVKSLAHNGESYEWYWDGNVAVLTKWDDRLL